MKRDIRQFVKDSKIIISSYNPESNRALGRCHRTLEKLLRAEIENKQNDWC